MIDATNTTFILFGISGDLSRRKILPAFIHLYQAGQLPSRFHLVGISRKDISLDDIFNSLFEKFSPEIIEGFQKMCEIIKFDMEKIGEFERLEEKLSQIDLGVKENKRLFYLSVPPETLLPIVGKLGQARSKNINTKLLLEKPFGVSRLSAENLIVETNKYFTKNEVYHIDHYLAKEMVQNIFRWRNTYPDFENTLNHTLIERIEIRALESIGIEGRIGFYEETGALRDLIQSHLIEILAGLLRNLVSSRSHAIEQLSVLNAYRGQYITYKDEIANNTSTTETFAELQLSSNDSRWRNTSFILSTGKAMNHKESNIRFYMRGITEPVVFHIQPNIDIECGEKTPEPLASVLAQMKVELTQFKKEKESYQTILTEAIAGHHELFIEDEEALASWQLIDQVRAKWQLDSSDLIIYDKGSKLADIRKKYEHNKNQ